MIDLLHAKQKQKRGRGGKFSDEVVRELRKRYREGETLEMLAECFRTGKTAISNALKGKTYSHVENPIERLDLHFRHARIKPADRERILADWRTGQAALKEITEEYGRKALTQKYGITAQQLDNCVRTGYCKSLTEEQKRQMVAEHYKYRELKKKINDDYSQLALAAEWDVSPQYIYAICTGKQYAKNRLKL